MREELYIILRNGLRHNFDVFETYRAWAKNTFGLDKDVVAVVSHDGIVGVESVEDLDEK